MGEELTPETRSRITRWEHSPRGQHGEHRYEAAGYGIDLDDLYRRYEFYRRRFSLR